MEKITLPQDRLILDNRKKRSTSLEAPSTHLLLQVITPAQTADEKFKSSQINGPDHLKTRLAPYR